MSFDLAIARVSEIRDHIATLTAQATAAPSAQHSRTGNVPMGGPIEGQGHGTTEQVNGGGSRGWSGIQPNTTLNFGDLLTKELSRVLGATSLDRSRAEQPGVVNPPAHVGQGEAVSGQSASAAGDRVVAEAKRWIGVPYKWGGNTRAGVDCSGLTKNVFAKYGVDLHRVARQQMTQGTEVPSLDQARPGDLIVFKNGKHIGIYAGNGQMIDAPRPGKNVQLRDVYETPTTIRRVL
ncbi:C40 family peptidase [Jonesiaceae bacterium BS-20]|uniref:C40 family peptidase n=1 Tax=Jonesiaceae bacterium BS-20 TaxID=3120821 RepID=A0AAU7DYW2_9MICO